MKRFFFPILFLFITCNSEPENVDILITGGIIHDGTGNKGYLGNVAIKNDTIFYVGKNQNFIAKDTIEASDKIISPGFVNMLSWGYYTLMQDGRSLSDLKQGVTLEVFGEGTSPGPRGSIENNNFVGFGEAMEDLEISGVSTNIASFLGAATVRIQEIGFANRKATQDEIDSMKNIVRIAMEEGAMGIGSSLIYAPGDYADTDELVELSSIASSYGGSYISHMRNEDSRVLEAVDELLEIAERANIPSQIYHLKASRRPNWHLLDSVIKKVENARESGLKITADMYTYPASSTGLTGVIPTWVQEGGRQAWINRMKRPDIRERLFKDIRKELSEQPPEDILMVGFNKQSMSKKYRGMTIAEAAQLRGETPEETIVNLIIEDERDIRELLHYNLQNFGFVVNLANNGESGLQLARKNKHDLILLDLMLPGMHGLEVCRIIKSDNKLNSIPVIMLTALGQEENIVKGLESGADDYITKPFSFKILHARIKSVIRRGKLEHVNKKEEIKTFDIKINFIKREVFVKNKSVKNLTFTEFEILKLLASHPGWVFTRYQIINKIRGENHPVTDRSIDFQIVGLRKKLGEAGSDIQTIRGVGYRFKNNES